jgi:hypothetical protein
LGYFRLLFALQIFTHTSSFNQWFVADILRFQKGFDVDVLGFDFGFFGPLFPKN